MRILSLLFIGLSFFTINADGQAPIDIAFYLENAHVSKAAKDLYNNRLVFTDNSQTISIIDSLQSKNDMTRPFYMYLVARMSDKADGALSEMLSNACTKLVEQQPDHAINFLYSTNRLIEKKFCDNWARQMAGEFKIDCGEGKEGQCLRRSLQQALTKCSESNKTRLNIFYQLVESHCH